MCCTFSNNISTVLIISNCHYQVVFKSLHGAVHIFKKPISYALRCMSYAINKVEVDFISIKRAELLNNKT